MPRAAGHRWAAAVEGAQGPVVADVPEGERGLAVVHVQAAGRGPAAARGPVAGQVLAEWHVPEAVHVPAAARDRAVDLGPAAAEAVSLAQTCRTIGRR
jgi:hypothetical protein